MYDALTSSRKGKPTKTSNEVEERHVRLQSYMEHDFRQSQVERQKITKVILNRPIQGGKKKVILNRWDKITLPVKFMILKQRNEYSEGSTNIT